MQFIHEVAGRSNGVSNKVVPSKMWNFFEAGVYASGQFKQEIESRVSARDQRVKAEAESNRHAHACEGHRQNVRALKDANARLREARDRLYP
ncbi:MAG: hypothetical protein Q9175_004253 [Cornicularia normoerica]